MILAHILGIPIEETLLPWAGSGVGIGMLVLFSSTMLRRALERK
jgi:hypothetical protein